MPKSSFAAELVFRIDLETCEQDRRQHFEVKIFHLVEAEAALALERAKVIGLSLDHNYLNCDGIAVSCEFVGIRNLVAIPTYWEANQVWEEDIWLENDDKRFRLSLDDQELLERI